jgi:hypothetical protein
MLVCEAASQSAPVVAVPAELSRRRPGAEQTRMDTGIAGDGANGPRREEAVVKRVFYKVRFDEQADERRQRLLEIATQKAVA